MILVGVFALAVALTTFSSIVRGYKTEGHVKLDDTGFGWIGKFCYDYNEEKYDDGQYHTAGMLHLTLTNEDGYDEDNKTWSIVLFDDESDSFHDIYPQHKHHYSCEEKRNISTHARYNGEFRWDSEGKSTHDLTIHQHLRPRFWWAYVSNCHAQANGVTPKIKFTAHFYQYNAEDWTEELGMNETGMNSLYLSYFFIFAAILSLQTYAYLQYKARTSNVHLVVKLLCIAMGLQFMSILFHLIDYTTYTNTGYRQQWAEIIANLFEIMASSVFLLQLLVMASGWTITNIEFEYKRHAAVGVVVLFLLKLSFWLWRSLALDPERTTYFYNTAPMIVYGVLMACVGVAFDILIFRSYRSELLYHKKRLYLALGLVYTVWFWTPLLQIGVGDAFDPWVRDVATSTLELTIDTIALSVMGGLLWPAWANRYFQLDLSGEAKRILGGIDASVQDGGATSARQADWDRL
jgi:hypothetical protein